MNSTIDRKNFSARLRHALSSTCGIDAPYALAREFNHRFGGDAISVHAARKWLLGEAIPTQSKLRALAHWLGVSPEWLRFGTFTPMLPSADKQLARLEEADLMLIADLKELDPHHRRMAAAFVRQLVAAQQCRQAVQPASAGERNAIVRHD